MSLLNRRSFLGASALLPGAVLFPGSPANAAPASAAPRASYKLGMVTYNMGKDMTLPDLLAFCQATGLEGVELRTTHKHGVEVTLTPAERAAVKAQFAASGVQLAGLGTTCEFHAQDPGVVRKNIEEAKAFAQLAADVGAPGIKLRPNGLYEDEAAETTIARIGAAWHEVAAFAAGLGVQTRMEVHGGRGSADPANIRKMVEAAQHPNARVCWNSNTGEVDASGSIRANFALLSDYISLVHINEIGVYQYPWQELFDLLASIGYTGFCLAEISFNPEPERFMKYYRTLFDCYTGRYQFPQPQA